MSVADKVGASSSFGRTRRSERGRAKAITEGAIPTYELVRLDLTQVSPTPLNPRRNFGTDEEMTRFGEELRQVQLAACVAVTRVAYLKLWPAHEDAIGDRPYVLVNGERRYRSARHVGVEQLDFVVRDDLASSREDFVDHLLAENLDREDFDVIERARGVQQLVDVCAEEGGERGARSRAADRLGKDRSWVTNQLALLTLPDELKIRLSSGEISERDGRLLARRLKDDPTLNAGALLEYLAAAKEAASQQREAQQRLIAAGRQVLGGDSLSADNETTSAAARASTADTKLGPDLLLSADNKTASPAAPVRTADTQPGRDVSLSADNESAPSVAPASTGPDVLLSADNKTSAPSAASEREQAPAIPASPEVAVPSQGSSHAEALPSAEASVSPSRAALIELEKHAQSAGEFAASLGALWALYRKAAEADREAADKLIGFIHEQIQKALRQLPAELTRS
jgi:ParB family chromosome partitioning protein